jgi:hydroxymethylglutaryl-CoA lyase
MLKLVECPRDAMQGLKAFIPTELKAMYINQLLKVGFDTIDFGSFVSPKAIPQLKDTADVLNQLDLSVTKSKLLTIVANQHGAEGACQYEEINYLGFPYSISETFQQLNTNANIQESLVRAEAIQNLCIKNNKELIVYIAMGFGNPYKDPWNLEILHKAINDLNQLGIKIIPLSDIMGTANAERIGSTFDSIISGFQNIEFGLHLHTSASDYYNKVDIAYNVGCRRFDMVINGNGGCPKTGKELVGNLDTLSFYNYAIEQNLKINLNKNELTKAKKYAKMIFT